MISIARGFSLLGPTLLLAAAAVVPTDAPPEVAEAKALAASGKHEEALAAAERGMELAPDDPDLLAIAARATAELGRKDEACWYGGMALAAMRSVPARAAEAKDLSARVAALDPLAGKGAAALDGWSAAIFALAKSCASRKLYANAVELYARLDGTAYEEKATAELAKLYGNKQAVEELLATGLDVPMKAEKKRPPEVIAREDQKHEEWESAWQIKGTNYTVVTNLGQELANSMSSAMEQMNRFYRKVFGVREHGGNTARCTIKVYRSRKEFDDFEDKPKPTVRGFFVPGENRVATYDHRTDGGTLAFLWVTLFHESSHQFTHMIMADLAPAWLNEGTASYFEGARILPNGAVETNLVPEHRLKALAASLPKDTGPSSGPSLREVVSYYQPGSYPGEYYPFGWGLVYFFLNYEDESCARPYEAVYKSYMDSYRTGGQHDPFQRFVDYFVTKAKQPGVTSFEQFEGRFKDWILALADLYYGPPEKADLLIARARKQRDANEIDAAAESYRWAIDKRPGDALANFELGELCAEAKDKDEALFRLRTALATLAALAPEAKVPGPTDMNAGALSARCRERMAALDKDFDTALRALSEKWPSAVQESAQASADAEFPRAALQLLRSAERLGGATSANAALAEKIETTSLVDLARWRRIAVPGDLAGWEGDSRWKVREGALVAGEQQGLSLCTWNGDVGERYRFQARIAPDAMGGDAMVGLVFGSNDGGVRMIAVFDDGVMRVLKFAESLESLAQLAPVDKDQLADFVLAVDVRDGRAEIYLGEKKVGRVKAKPGELAGSIGVFVQSVGARFSEMRILE